MMFLIQMAMAEQDLHIVDGRVAKAPIPGCESLEVDGLHVTAGLIDPSTSLGLTEVSMEHRGEDSSSSGAGYRVADGYNPRSTLIPVARMGGVTHAITVPSGHLVGGTGAFVQLSGEHVAMVAGIGGNGAESLYRLRLLLDEARRYRGSWDSTTFTHPEADLKALQPVLRGDRPLVISVDRASDIEALLRFVDEQRIQVVLKGASEAWMLADELADMLARLEADQSRQQAVEAAVLD